MGNPDCPFCARLDGREAMASSACSVAFFDAYPLNPGHALVVPRRHVADLFDLDQDELADVWRLVGDVKARLARDLSPEGFNVGVNVGSAAGQTVGHAHVHVIPRHLGDVPDPRGGIRWVIPARAAYWVHSP